MLRKDIELDFIELDRYEKVKEKVKLRRAKDKAIMFEKFEKEFIEKYELSPEFFDVNFFQNIAKAYSEVSKKAVEYYNNTNKEISITRGKILKKYGFESDKEYKDAISFDKSKEILGLPSYLNPQTSLVVLKRKFSDSFIEYWNDLFFSKIIELFSIEIEREKNNLFVPYNKDGKSRLEEILNDYQTVMYLFLYLRLNICDVVMFDSIVFGRTNYEKLHYELKNILEYRDPILMAYTEKQEISDRWSKMKTIDRIKDFQNVKNQIKEEYVQNRNAVLDYRIDYNYDNAMSKLIKFDERKYAERISMAQVLFEKYYSKFILLRPIFYYEKFLGRRIERLLVTRHPELYIEKVRTDVSNKNYKSNKTYKYEEVCEEIDNNLVNIGMLMNYAYDMDSIIYNANIMNMLIELESAKKEELGMKEKDYEDYEDRLIVETLGPQFLEGYVEPATGEKEEF